MASRMVDSVNAAALSARRRRDTSASAAAASPASTGAVLRMSDVSDVTSSAMRGAKEKTNFLRGGGAERGVTVGARALAGSRQPSALWRPRRALPPPPCLVRVVRVVRVVQRLPLPAGTHHAA